MDARVSLVQNVVDLSSVRRFQASKALVRAARAEGENTDEMIAGQVARAYLGVLRREAEVEAAGANVELAEAILKTTENQKAAGAGTAIEVTRAKVEAANQRQRLLVAQNERRRAKLILLRTMGLRLDTEYELTDQLRYIPVEPEIVANAHVDAVKSRLDLRAQAERESNSRLAASAAKMERLPTLAAYSDYGTTGSGFDRAVPTRTYGVSLRVPLYDGGRRDARRSDAASQYRQEKIRSNDLRDQIDLEVQTATDTLQSAEEQVQVAEVGLHLAENELDQARRRYEAGVASNLEVTDAQTRLERARNNRITALFSHNLARIDLGQATGSIRKMIQ
jgi:outer membrane protein TolC